MRLLPAALVALILVSASQAQDDTIDFGFYPKGAQDCMYKAANDSKCKAKTVVATNSCLCRNGGNFITNAAACIGQSSPSDLEEVYKVMSGACGESDTAISITKDEFMAAANAATSTTSTAGPTTTSSTSKSGTTTGTDASTTSETSTGTAASTAAPAEGEKEGEEEGGGLKTGVMAGIIVGAVGAAVLLGALAFFLFRRRRKLGEESHPMLPQQGHPSVAAGNDSSAMHSSAYYSSPPSTAGWPKQDWQGPSPDLRSSGFNKFNWESPAHLSYPGGGGTLAPSPPLPPQELDGSQYVAPTGSTQAPAEMPGEIPAVATAPGNALYRPYNPGQRYPASG
jgi:LPXTG-motif cell wall-anchored protein